MIWWQWALIGVGYMGGFTLAVAVLVYLGQKVDEPPIIAAAIWPVSLVVVLVVGVFLLPVRAGQKLGKFVDARMGREW